LRLTNANFGIQGHQQPYDSSTAFEPEGRKRTRGTTCANFGFAALQRPHRPPGGSAKSLDEGLGAIERG